MTATVAYFAVSALLPGETGEHTEAFPTLLEAEAFARRMSRFLTVPTVVHLVPDGWEGLDWEGEAVSAYEDGRSVEPDDVI